MGTTRNIFGQSIIRDRFWNACGKHLFHNQYSLIELDSSFVMLVAINMHSEGNQIQQFEKFCEKINEAISLVKIKGILIMKQIPNIKRINSKYMKLMVRLSSNSSGIILTFVLNTICNACDVMHAM